MTEKRYTIDGEKIKNNHVNYTQVLQNLLSKERLRLTEKRFWSENYGVGYYTEIVDNEKELEDVPNPKKNLLIEEVIDLLNELVEENEQLKSDIFNLNKSVECLNETVKEQCNKLDWASECSVRWEEEYTKWIGD